MVVRSSGENDLARVGWCNGHKPLRHAGRTHQTLFQDLHFVLAPPRAFAVRLAYSIHGGMFAGVGHIPSEPQHGLFAEQQFPIPVDLQDAPAALDRVVLAVIRRVVDQFDRQLCGLRHSTKR